MPLSRAGSPAHMQGGMRSGDTSTDSDRRRDSRLATHHVHQCSLVHDDGASSRVVILERGHVAAPLVPVRPASMGPRLVDSRRGSSLRCAVVHWSRVTSPHTDDREVVGHAAGERVISHERRGKDTCQCTTQSAWAACRGWHVDTRPFSAHNTNRKPHLPRRIGMGRRRPRIVRPACGRSHDGRTRRPTQREQRRSATDACY